jgi:hypothetical protein
MSERRQESDRLWSFPDGMLGHDDSIKDFQVEATDGDAGKVSWASYAPGESYLVIGDRDGGDLAPEGVGALPVSHASTGLR